MTLEQFTLLAKEEPPENLPAPLVALLHDCRGNWEAAHDRSQKDPSPSGAWVHAYLHRKEGDPGNALYWYRRAGQPMANGDLQAEWARIAKALLERAKEIP